MDPQRGGITSPTFYHEHSGEHSQRNTTDRYTISAHHSQHILVQVVFFKKNPIERSAAVHKKKIIQMMINYRTSNLVTNLSAHFLYYASNNNKAHFVLIDLHFILHFLTLKYEQNS